MAAYLFRRGIRDYSEGEKSAVLCISQTHIQATHRFRKVLADAGTPKVRDDGDTAKNQDAVVSGESRDDLVGAFHRRLHPRISASI